MKIRNLIQIVSATAILFVVSGCGAGDENPISPEKMEEIRNKTAKERGSFNPGSTQSPGATTPR